MLGLIVGLGDAGGGEGVGFNHIGASTQVGSVDLLNDVWLCQHKKIIVALQGLGVVGEARA